MAVPPKYQRLGTFHKYYSGIKVVPYPTIFIGGNHEASNYLWELYYGGWAAQNLYFLGCGGVINVGGVRIAGASGIYKANDYNRGHYEKAPYSPSHLRSIYHVREYDIRKLGLVRSPIDIMLSHDWPRGIEQFGNVRQLLREKKFFAAEVARNDLGSPANEELLAKLCPTYWFSAHLHVKFPALVHHDEWLRRNTRPQQPTWPGARPAMSRPQAVGNPDEIVISMDDDDTGAATNLDEIEIDLDEPTPISAGAVEPISTSNPDEIVMDDDDFDEPVGISIKDIKEEVEKSQPSSTPIDAKLHDASLYETTENRPAVDNIETVSKTTRFLSLDKCMPRRQFLQVLDVPSAEGDLTFEYDLEWLAITQVTNPFLSLEYRQPTMPNDEALLSQIQQKIEELKRKVVDGTLDLKIPQNFATTAPPHDHSHNLTPQEIDQYIIPYANPQTEQFCQMLEIDNKFKDSRRCQPMPATPAAIAISAVDTDDADAGATPPKRPKLDLPPPQQPSAEEEQTISNEESI